MRNIFLNPSESHVWSSAAISIICASHYDIFVLNVHAEHEYTPPPLITEPTTSLHMLFFVQTIVERLHSQRVYDNVLFNVYNKIHTVSNIYTTTPWPCLLHGFPGFLMLDFFPPKEILKLFCIVKIFTCFPRADICVLLINAVDLDGVIPDDVGTATVLIFVVG